MGLLPIAIRTKASILLIDTADIGASLGATTRRYTAHQAHSRCALRSQPSNSSSRRPGSLGFIDLSQYAIGRSYRRNIGLLAQLWIDTERCTVEGDAAGHPDDGTPTVQEDRTRAGRWVRNSGEAR
jgi:hypothetical protein